MSDRSIRIREQGQRVASTNPDAPIGVFDSGLGGLTVVRAIQQRLPGETGFFQDGGHAGHSGGTYLGHDPEKWSPVFGKIMLHQ